MRADERAQFSIGQVVRHKLFSYRGVVIDVDASFSLSDEWYDQVATSRPPKDAPWYHVLVDGSDHRTYVAQRNLDIDDSAEPVRNPAVGEFFEGRIGEGYIPKRMAN